MKQLNDLYEQIRLLPALKKMRLVESLVSELERPNPELKEIWATELEKRCSLIQDGEQKTISYDSILDKYQTHYSSEPKQIG